MQHSGQPEWAAGRARGPPWEGTFKLTSRENGRGLAGQDWWLEREQPRQSVGLLMNWAKIRTARAGDQEGEGRGHFIGYVGALGAGREGSGRLARLCGYLYLGLRVSSIMLRTMGAIYVF